MISSKCHNHEVQPSRDTKSKINAIYETIDAQPRKNCSRGTLEPIVEKTTLWLVVYSHDPICLCMHIHTLKQYKQNIKRKLSGQPLKKMVTILVLKQETEKVDSRIANDHDAKVTTKSISIKIFAFKHMFGPDVSFLMKSLNKTETPIFLSVVCSLFPKAIFLTFISTSFLKHCRQTLIITNTVTKNKQSAQLLS